MNPKKYIQLSYDKGYEDAIFDYKEQVLLEFCTCCNQEACEGGCIGSIQECESIKTLRDVLDDVAIRLKEMC